MLTAALSVAGGTVLLWIAAEGLVRGAASLGRRAGISAMVVGLTVVSIGTSAPELVVSIAAALEGRPGLALGNVFGSNLANIGLILAFAALVRPLPMAPAVIRRDLPWMLAVSVLVLPLLWNLRLGRLEGSVLAAVLVLYLVVLVRATRKRARTAEGESKPRSRGRATRHTAPGISHDEGLRVYAVPLLLIVGGSLGLVAGGRLIVSGASVIAAELGISEMIVGLSIVAVGTSLPELATTVIAALKREGDLAIGNILGSNIFNLTLVLGSTALVRPLSVDPGLLRVEYPAILVLSFALLPLAWTRGRVTRREGAFLLGLYVAAWGWILVQSGTGV